MNHEKKMQDGRHYDKFKWWIFFVENCLSLRAKKMKGGRGLFRQKKKIQTFPARILQQVMIEVKEILARGRGRSRKKVRKLSSLRVETLWKTKIPEADVLTSDRSLQKAKPKWKNFEIVARLGGNSQLNAKPRSTIVEMLSQKITSIRRQSR